MFGMLRLASSEDTATAPGSAVLTGTVLGVVVLLCVHLDWAPFVRNLTGPDQLVGLVAGGILLGFSLLAWAIKTLYLLGREHRWSWKVAAVPVVVLAGLVAGLVFQPASFDSARPEMEKVAVEMLHVYGVFLTAATQAVGAIYAAIGTAAEVQIPSLGGTYDHPGVI